MRKCKNAKQTRMHMYKIGGKL